MTRLLGATRMAWLIAACTVALPASAIPVDYVIQQGAEPGFQFSFIHSATSNCCGVPSQYANNGTKLFRIDGTISADWDAGTERADLLVDSILSATVLSATVPGALVGDVFQLILKAGSFLENTPNERAEGELIYELYDPDDLVTPVATGTFYLFPETSFPDASNRVSDTRFTAWANNWLNGTDPVPTGGFYSALGIDMVSVPGPAPVALMVFAGAMLRLRARSL